MKGVETVAVMGALYLFAYFVAVGIAVALVGALILSVIALVSVVYFLVLVSKAIERNNIRGALLLLLTPVVLSGMSFIFVLAYVHGEFYFPSFMANLDSWPEGLQLFAIPVGLYAIFGWYVTVALGAKAAQDFHLDSEAIGVYAIGILASGTLWAFIGGSAWAGMALGINS